MALPTKIKSCRKFLKCVLYMPISYFFLESFYSFLKFLYVSLIYRGTVLVHVCILLNPIKLEFLRGCANFTWLLLKVVISYKEYIHAYLHPQNQLRVWTTYPVKCRIVLDIQIHTFMFFTTIFLIIKAMNSDYYYYFLTVSDAYWYCEFSIGKRKKNEISG